MPGSYKKDDRVLYRIIVEGLSKVTVCLASASQTVITKCITKLH